MHNSAPKSLSRYWLLLGVAALAIAGLFSLILVIARTPSLASLPLFADLFHKSLVVHVDLSVLVWFLSIACLLWSRLAEPSPRTFPYLEEASLISFALGMAAIALSALDTHSQPLMSNYVPVITSPVFFLGVSLLFSGVLLMLVRMFTAKTYAQAHGEEFPAVAQFGIVSAGYIGLIAAMCFVWSFHQMPRDIEGQQFFELGFWGGGHVLQFLHTQVLLVCWLMLMKTLEPSFTLPPALLRALFSVGLLSAFAAPFVYMLHDVTSMQHRNYFTFSMIVVGGIAPAVLAFRLAPKLWATRALRQSGQKALWSSLLMSVVLFIYGGLLGCAIQGQNVVIPAHYHGSIVGVTLAFMGAAYWLLPQFGYRDVSGWRMTFWQPIVYGGGQLMHISGLAWSGGYGVLRKTPGGMENLPVDVKAAMGFMGLGGLIAIIGGFMFVIVVGKALLKK